MATADNIEVIHNEDKMRFEVLLNGEYASIEYRYYKRDMAFMHTTVPEIFRGKGIAGEMARAALDYATKKRLKIMLYCPFVSKYVREHPEYHSLVDANYHPSFKSTGNP